MPPAILQYWAVTTERRSLTKRARCLPYWKSYGWKRQRSWGWGRTRRTERAACRAPSSHMFRGRLWDTTAVPRNDPETSARHLYPWFLMGVPSQDRADMKRRTKRSEVSLIRFGCNHTLQCTDPLWNICTFLKQNYRNLAWLELLLKQHFISYHHKLVLILGMCSNHCIYILFSLHIFVFRLPNEINCAWTVVLLNIICYCCSMISYFQIK